MTTPIITDLKPAEIKHLLWCAIAGSESHQSQVSLSVSIAEAKVQRA